MDDNAVFQVCWQQRLIYSRPAHRLRSLTMRRTRRDFIRTGTAAGAAFGTVTDSPLGSAQPRRRVPMPTPRAKALMELFGLKYPIFEAPHGPGTTPPGAGHRDLQRGRDGRACADGCYSNESA